MGSVAVLLAAVVVWMGPLAASAAAQAQTDSESVSGVYECQGIGADGRPYQGAVIIAPDGHRFLVRWIIAAELSAVGVGIRDGDVLAVSFYGADTGGIIIYRIEGERLVGQWSAPLARGQVFQETLTRVHVPMTAPSEPPTSWRPVFW